MTVSLVDDPDHLPSQLPSFLDVHSASEENILAVARAIAGAKRIVVVCGAGISVAAGIPDFRSSEGLFKSLKMNNPKELLTSGKDLFDASVFNTPQTTALFYKMIAQLSSISSSASPTPFHDFIKLLDDRGQLLRLYTQNIDNLEEKAGLTCGVPHWNTPKRNSPSKRASKIIPPVTSSPPPSIPSETSSDSGSTADNIPPLPGPSKPPRCIPLHGTLKYLTCQRCSNTVPLSSQLSTLAQGLPVPCPQCASLNSTRRLIGKRDRGIGTMRPSVVLYGEVHQEGEGVGECVRRDLLGLSDVAGPSNSSPSSVAGSQGYLPTPSKVAAPRVRASAKPDLLIVAGSSLKVPGTKRIVREFAKAVQATHTTSANTPSSSLIQSPSTIYLNLDFPVPSREWQGVFDVWIQGDLQAVVGAFSKAIDDRDASETSKNWKRKKPPSHQTGRPPKARRTAVDGDVPSTPSNTDLKKQHTASMQTTHTLHRSNVTTSNDLTWHPTPLNKAPPISPIKRKPPRLILPRTPPTTPVRPRSGLGAVEVVITSSPDRWHSTSTALSHAQASPKSPTPSARISLPFLPLSMPSSQLRPSGKTATLEDAHPSSSRKGLFKLPVVQVPSISNIRRRPPTTVDGADLLKANEDFDDAFNAADALLELRRSSDEGSMPASEWGSTWDFLSAEDVRRLSY